MKKRVFICLVLILLFAVLVNAGLNVELKEPKNNIEIRSEINNLNFKCNVTSGGTNIDSVRLYTNIFGGWQQTGSTLFNQKEGMVSFLIINISQGTFMWNCLATIPGETKFASTNFTFTFAVPENIKPIFNGTVPDQSWYQDKSLNNAINLKNYFIDMDNKPQPLQFSISGNSNIDITLSNGVVSFSQPPGWFGVETVYFTASDGQDSVQSNPIKLTVIKNATSSSENQTTLNTAPVIDPAIPDQTKKPGDIWTLHLNSYVEDSESPKDTLKWRVENVNDNIVNISISNISKEATFTAISEGEDTVRFIVEDSGGLKDEQEILIQINNTEDNILEEELKGALEIISKEPKNKTVEVKQSGKQIFKIDTSIKNDINVSWFVDGIYQEEAGRKFEYLAGAMGKHKIEVLVEKDGETVSNEWEVFVTEGINKTNINAVALTQSLCGNNKTDEGENCENCPGDVKCSEGEVCKDQLCVKEEKNNIITGFLIKNFNELNLSKKIIGAVGGVFMLFFIIIMIIRTRNVRKKKLTSFGAGYKTKKSFFDRFKKKDEGFVTIEPKKQILKEEEVKSTVNPPSGIEPIIGFINSGLASGDNSKSIKKALLRSGWSRKQVKQAFKSVK